MKNGMEMPPLMILCGGKGTRLREVTELLPKPMVNVGEQPIVWHIMKSYAAFGVRRFILCLGYKKEAFIDYFLNYHLRTADATISLGAERNIRFHGDSDEADWEVTFAGTGLETMTGGRVRLASRRLRPEDGEFFLTYGDGVSDINIAGEYQFHRAHGKLATVAAVHPAARFGEMKVADGMVTGFEEKPAVSEGFINGGFMILKREFVTRFLTDEDEFLEQAPMNRAVKAGEMAAFEHNGFWQCMDTPREHALLDRMWNQKCAPWTKYWK